MKNIMGEEYVRQPLTIEPATGRKVAWVKRGSKVVGYAYANGWNGKDALCEYDVGDPVLTLFSPNESISFKEMEQVMAAFKQAFPS